MLRHKRAKPQIKVAQYCKLLSLKVLANSMSELLLAYHLEDSRVQLVVRVPQFGSHCSKEYAEMQNQLNV